MHYPDFLIIGTMKGGTTALYDFITSHKDVSAASQKELHFFSLHQHKGIDWYLSHFQKEEGKLTGEASPTYFDAAYTNAIPLCIKQQLPNVKLILIVRDPVERAVSHFFHLCKINRIEHLIKMDINEFFGRDFSHALKQTTLIDFYLHQVLFFSCYYRKYLTYLSVFEENRILVLTNSELRMYPQDTMKKVFNFLGLSQFKSRDFDKIKYSTGSDKKVLTEKIKNKLEDFLYPDYESFLSTCGITEKNIKKQKRIADIHVGKDGWIFLTGGSNAPLFYYTEHNAFDAGLVGAWSNLLRTRHNWFEKNKITYVHIIVPDKLTIYPEHFAGNLEYYACHPINSMLTGISLASEKDLLGCLINPVPYFNQQKEKYQLFWKTDTHWTFWGCYSAYQLICARIGVPQHDNLVGRSFGEGILVMDLGSKLNPPVEEKVRFYNVLQDAQRAYANDIVLFKENNKRENEEGLHVGSHVVFENRKAVNKQRVLLFGDSYSEYRTHLLTGLLAETFAELHFIWSTSLDYGYIERIKPDIVITEIAERFMSQVPKDDFDLASYVEKKKRQFNIT